MNVIPGEVELGIDIRSVDDTMKRNFAEVIKKFCRKIEKKNGVSIEISTLVDNDSVALHESMQEKLMRASEELGYSTIAMNSGAGHDVMNMATKWPSGLIFIPCKDGLSHHPAEYASIENIEKGTNVIVEFLQKEANMLE